MVSLGDPNAVVGTRLQFNVATPQNYSVFTVNGNYVGTVYGLSAGIAEQVRGLVKNPGIYVAKPAYGPAVKFNVK